MRIIATEADLDEGLAHLAAADPRLVPVIAAAGRLPFRRRGPGFEGLARIIVGQQLSIASAAAIWNRFAAAIGAVTPDTVTAAGAETLRGAGLSAGKMRTLRAIAAASLGGLDLAGLVDRPAEEAIAALTAIHGVGPWTADIYLLFCLGHADVFPVGDLALRNAVAHALDLPDLRQGAELAAIAAHWSPWRGVAAFLFWAYYGALRAKTVVPA